MDKTRSLFHFLAGLLLNFGNYDLIREVIWSIVWCDNWGKKEGQLRALKYGHSFVEKLKMEYLSSHIRSLNKDYRFWMNFKKAFEIAELTFSFICFVCVFFVESHPLCEYIFIAYDVQVFAVSFLWLGLAAHYNGRNKYDRIRMQKRSKSKYHRIRLQKKRDK